ncbi:DEAD/DEAH box helicase [Succinatimonas hippei]|uniref:DEAD/DEAH box helicase n=1 Tax=Succinatimonas hippei TaxID=626938 RepID=UPI0026F1D42A|nr:DEAD/DEAH box helicase [Succinatimonas hippei]
MTEIVNNDEIKEVDNSEGITVSVGADESLLLKESEEQNDEQVAVEEEKEPELISFDSLQLSPLVLQAIKDLGFESPTPIQERAIPVMMSGDDMIGQAQTGTGKTAAFALPILSKLEPENKNIFALVLEPTRELALQVAESFQAFARHIEDFHVVPIYGGASYDNQIRSIRHGAQVVVATPGRLIDLIERGKIDLSSVSYMVIDEADEMLRMGFIDDVDWILNHTPAERHTALFSATMPEAIRRIARDHLNTPVEVRIESKTTTATTVHQRYWVVSGVHKIDAMTRILEVEPYDAVLVFVRTKTDAEDVANKLMARGMACAALHGDIPQRQREKIIERLKNGSLDIIIATDVAARGLDVDRITHVFNYDIPYDAESYVHRIGRTGRAGRQGEAILFVSPRERRALRQIERVTRQRIEPMRMPTVADVNKRRLENFRNQILETIEAGELGMYLEVVSDILSDDSIEPEMLAAALAKMAQRGNALLLDETGPEPEMRTFDDRHERRERRLPSAEPVPLRDFPDMKMVRYRLAVGHRDGVKPGQIVGAIANEADMDSKYIGEISIFDSFSTVDLPEGMPEDTKRVLAAARVCGRALDLREYTAEPPRRRPPRHFDAPRREDFADEGEYRHEPGDINGNSIDYDPRRSRRDFRPRRNDYDRRSSFNLDFNRPRRNGGMRRNGFRRDGF